MAVHVSATFKKDERESNGLEAIREELINTPLVRHVIVATIETTQIITDVRDGGVKTPRVRLVNVEALDGDQAVIGRKLLDERYASRTGQTAPPPTLFDPDEAQIAPAVEVDAGDQGEEPPWDEGPPSGAVDPDIAGPGVDTGRQSPSKRPRR